MRIEKYYGGFAINDDIKTAKCSEMQFKQDLQK